MARHTDEATITAGDSWTDELTVQAHQRVNVSLRVSDPSDRADCRLQRQLPGDATTTWRDVGMWSLSAGGFSVGFSAGFTSTSQPSVEAITAYPEQETCQYRLGVGSGEFYTGVAVYARLGTA